MIFIFFDEKDIIQFSFIFLLSSLYRSENNINNYIKVESNQKWKIKNILLLEQVKQILLFSFIHLFIVILDLTEL